ncbi:MAG: HRDC domain-containing protein [Tenericutes bacterium]|nr:HRDC domain-containing protein [Mycoplasmatota bacterium]
MFDVINRIVDNTMYRFKNQVLYKEDTTTQKELDRMKEYLKTHPNKDLENKVKLFEYGLAGEKQVLYELLHSGIGMYILHNVSFEYKGKSAQIDFVVITARCTYFIECKNFIGNITINSKGDFVRTYMKNNRKVTEGTYNPITQSKRHLEIIKEENYDNANILYKMNFEKTFDSFHDYIVVMANPKTIINDKYAPKNIKERLVKADQIIECLKRLESKRDPFRFEKDIKKVADVYIESNREKSLLKSFIAEDEKENIKGDNKETIRSELKKYRLQKAKSLNYKPYFIFNDQTLEEILSIMPRTLTDLKKISGFGDKKIEFYGQDIINIINERSEEII